VDRPVKLTEADFDRVIADASVPVLVDFYADWCGPCKVMAPVLDEVARKRTGSLLVAKVDSDHAPGLSQRFGIRGIPTLVLFKDGRELRRKVGAGPRSELEALIDAA
jgi:thioredoxin